MQNHISYFDRRIYNTSVQIKWQGIYSHLQNIMYNDNLGYLIKWESEINNTTLSWACDKERIQNFGKKNLENDQQEE